MPEISIDHVVSIIELWQAAYSGDVEKLREFLADPVLRAKINYKMRSQGNHTALFFACYGAANAETIELLLNAGADPLLRDNRGRLPLHFAANTQDPALIGALLKVPNMRSYRLDSVSDNGQTPFHALFLPDLGVSSAIKSKNADLSRCISLFLEAGNNQVALAALRKTDNNGLSPLTLVKYYNHRAAFYPHVPPKTFEILLKSIPVPGNIEELLKSNVSNENFEVNKDIVNISANENADDIERISFKLK